MQIMCIEFAKNVLNITKACTEEIDSLKNYVHIVHSIEPNKENIKNRLGNFDIKIKKDSFAYNICKTDIVNERHRHKYKINKDYINEFEKKGLYFTGMSLDNVYVEIVEYPKNDFFFGIQYHPELNSTIFKPHSIFIEYLKSIK
jgi:CTP synthase